MVTGTRVPGPGSFKRVAGLRARGSEKGGRTVSAVCASRQKKRKKKKSKLDAQIRRPNLKLVAPKFCLRFVFWLTNNTRLVVQAR